MKKLFLISLLAISFPLFSFAQAPVAVDLQALIKQLQEQVKILQVQIQELKWQLAATKEEVAVTKLEVAGVKEELRLTRFLQRGEQGDEVKKLQEFLSQFPDIYPQQLITGFFGPLTEAAVRKLQEKHGIEQLGIIGPKTLSKINELITEGAGESGVVPPGLLHAPGIQQGLATGTPPMTPGATTTPLATSTIPAVPAQPVGQTGTTTVPAIPAVAIATSTSPAPSPAPAPTLTPPPSSPASGQVSSSGWTISAVSEGYDPALAWDGSGYGVAWASTDNDTRGEVYFARLDSNGTKIGGDLRLSNGTGQAGLPTIAWNGAEYGVVWSDKRGGIWFQLNFARVSAAGVKIGGDIQVTSHAIGHSRSPVLLWTGSEYGLFWLTTAYTSNSEVYFTRLSSSGTKLMSDTRITFNGVGNTSGLSVVWTGSEYGVVWQFPVASQPAHVYFQRISVQGAPIGTPLRLTSVAQGEPYPAVGWNGSGYGVVWIESRVVWSASLSIYISTSPLVFASVSAQGILQGAPVVVDGTRGVPRPSIIWGNGVFSVLYSDQRVSGTGTIIYFIQLNSDGVRQGSDLQITSAGTVSWDPELIFDGRSYAAVWEGSASGRISFVKSPAVALASSAATALTPAATPSSSPVTSTTTSSVSTATSTPPGDITPPVISNIQATNITATSAVITWTTNEATDSQVEYGLTTSYGSQSVMDIFRVATNHSATLTGLAASTGYHYRAKSRDTWGNLTTSQDYAFTTQTPVVAEGQQKWVFIPATTYNPPGADNASIGSDGTIYIGNSNGLFAINPDGTQKWAFVPGLPNNPGMGVPSIGSDGTLYARGAGAPSIGFYALNPDGSKKWEYPMSAYLFSGQPAVAADGTIYVVKFQEWQLYAFDSAGSIKWIFATTTRIASSPAIASDGTIYVGAYYDGSHAGSYGAVYALNPDGSIKWIFNIPKLTYFLSINGFAIGNDGAIYFGSSEGRLFALNPDGTQKWIYQLPGITVGLGVPSIAADGTLYVPVSPSGFSTKLVAINPSGTQKWTLTLPTSHDLTTPTIGADGTLYAGANSYGLYAVNPDGTTKWTWTGTDTWGYNTPSLASDGTIYIGSGASGKIYAIKGISLGLANSSWPRSMKNSRFTNRVSDALTEYIPRSKVNTIAAISPSLLATMLATLNALLKTLQQMR